MPYTLLQGGSCAARRRRRRRRSLALLDPARRRAAAARDATGERRTRRGAADPRRRAVALGRGTAPLAGGGTAPSPLAVRLEARATRCTLRFKQPPRAGPAVRPRHRPRAVAPRPDAGAADRLADEDDDRAGGRPTACRRHAKVHDHQAGAGLPGLGRRAAAARASAIGVEHDALRPAAAVGQRRGDRARPARRAAPCRASSR